MLHKVYINSATGGEKKFITSEGDLVGFEQNLTERIEKIGLKARFLAEVVSRFKEADFSVFTTYFTCPQREDSKTVSSEVIDVEVVKGNSNKISYVKVSRSSDVCEVTMTGDEFISHLVDRIVKDMKTSDFTEVRMAFPYKYIIFKTFERFSEEENPSVTGYARIGGEDVMTSVTEEMHGLVWPLESKTMKFYTEKMANEEIRETFRRLLEGKSPS